MKKNKRNSTKVETNEITSLGWVTEGTFSIPVGTASLALKQPLSWEWCPKKDITTYELAQLIPYIHGKVLFEEDIKENPELFRHLKLH